MNLIISQNFSNENTQMAAKEILKLIEQEKLSVAEIKGAAFEALLIVMQKHLCIKNSLEDSMS